MFNKGSLLKILGISTVLCTLSINANAIPVDFIDNDTTTIDLSSGLEWLDLTETLGRSYNDVYSDITTDGGQFDVADGWRHATKEEFISLVNRWFDPSVAFDGSFIHYADLGVNETNTDINEFITVFGDTIYSYYYEVGAWDSSRYDFNEGEGYSAGFLAIEDDNVQRSGIVADWERYYRWTFYDEEDNIKTLDLHYNHNHPYRNYGHYLVRDYSVAAVPIPAALPLFLTGLIGLGALRRRKKENV